MQRLIFLLIFCALATQALAQRSLDYTGKHIKSLSGDILKREKPKNLILLDNELSFLPPEISLLTDLDTLNLAANLFTIFPRQICNLPKLRYLTIEDNQITELSPDISGLKSLEYFYIGSTRYGFNPLKELPAEIGQLPKLKSLYLTNAKIQSLPEEIGNLSELRELQLQGCPIKALPESICNLGKLEFFSIAFTQVEKIPRCIGELQNLKELWLNSSASPKLPDLGNLKKLEHLSVLYSQIKKTPDWLTSLPLKTLTVYAEGSEKAREKIAENIKVILPETEINVYDISLAE